MITTWLIFVRAIHLGACLLFFGFFAFDRFVVTTISTNSKTEIDNYWQIRIRFFNLILLPVILLSGLAWFALVAMTMSGQPLQTEILKTVWTQTQFGMVWKIRLIFWLAAAVVTFFYFFRNQTTFQKFSVWLGLGMDKKARAGICSRTFCICWPVGFGRPDCCRLRCFCASCDKLPTRHAGIPSPRSSVVSRL